jgi:diacylglycerol kinase family enzyme
MYVGVIVNPNARKNRAASHDRIAALRRIVGSRGEVHETNSIEELHGAIQQLAPRVTHLVGDGGDGALHWLINEVERCIGDPQRWPAFVPTNGGSVNAVARKARVRGRPETIIRVKTPNYASILFTPTRARVVIDGDEVPSRTHSLLHAGAIDLRIGGPLRLFPKASEPGALHFQAGNLRPSRIVAQLPMALTNGKLRGKGLRDVNGDEMTIEAEDETLSPIIDGERFLGIVRLVARAGPRIRIARPS